MFKSLRQRVQSGKEIPPPGRAGGSAAAARSEDPPSVSAVRRLLSAAGSGLDVSGASDTHEHIPNRIDSTRNNQRTGGMYFADNEKSDRIKWKLGADSYGKGGHAHFPAELLQPAVARALETIGFQVETKIMRETQLTQQQHSQRDINSSSGSNGRHQGVRRSVSTSSTSSGTNAGEKRTFVTGFGYGTVLEGLDRAILSLATDPASPGGHSVTGWLWVDIEQLALHAGDAGASSIGACRSSSGSDTKDRSTSLAPASSYAFDSSSKPGLGLHEAMRSSRTRDSDTAPQPLHRGSVSRARGRSVAPPAPNMIMGAGDCPMEDVRVIEAVESFVQQALLRASQIRGKSTPTVEAGLRSSPAAWALVFHAALYAMCSLLKPARFFIYRRMLVRYLFLQQQRQRNGATMDAELKASQEAESAKVISQPETLQTWFVSRGMQDLYEQASSSFGSMSVAQLSGGSSAALLQLFGGNKEAASRVQTAIEEDGLGIEYGALPDVDSVAASPAAVRRDGSAAQSFVSQCIKYLESRVADPLGALVGLRPSMPCLMSALDRVLRDEQNRDAMSSDSLRDRITLWSRPDMTADEVLAQVRDFAHVLHAGNHIEPGSLVIVVGESAKLHPRNQAVESAVRAASLSRSMFGARNLPTHQRSTNRFEHAVFARVAFEQSFAGKMTSSSPLSVIFDPREIEPPATVKGTDVLLLPCIVRESIERADTSFVESLVDDPGTLLCYRLRIAVKSCVSDFLSQHPAVKLPDDGLTLDRWNQCMDISLADEEALKICHGGLSALVERAPEMPTELSKLIDALSFDDEVAALASSKLSVAPSRFFLPSQETSLVQTKTLVGSRGQIAFQVIVKFDSIVSTALREVSNARNAIISGQRKQELTDWWLTLVRTSVTDYLRMCDYDFDAVPVSYIEEPPQDMKAVERNLAIVRKTLHAISESRKPAGSPSARAPEVPKSAETVEIDTELAIGTIQALVTTIYPRLDAFVVEAKHILDQVSDLESLDRHNPLKQLEMDVKYVKRMHELEDIRVHVESKDIVPVTGLAMSRLVRTEQELVTVIEIWGSNSQRILQT